MVAFSQLILLPFVPEFIMVWRKKIERLTRPSFLVHRQPRMHPRSGWIFSASVLRRLRREPGEGLPLDAARKSWQRSTQLHISQIRPGRRGVSAAQKEGAFAQPDRPF